MNLYCLAAVCHLENGQGLFSEDAWQVNLCVKLQLLINSSPAVLRLKENRVWGGFGLLDVGFHTEHYLLETTGSGNTSRAEGGTFISRHHACRIQLH